jgi:hypothetical protein
MALWESNKITDIDIGTTPNDGTGDNIRDSFKKVDDNFANVSAFLNGTQVDFLNSTISNQLTSVNASFTNSFTANTTGTTANFTGNLAAANIIANSGLFSGGTTYFANTVYTSGNIIPTDSGVYDLGSVTRPFRNLYYVSAVSGGVAQTTDAGLLVVHANAAVGDVKDVGIFGNISHHYPVNTYSFFGYQYLTNDFVYKITNNNDADPIYGNSVVYSGIYGNVHFGSAFLSNTTASTSTTTGALKVAGGAGIAGNVNSGGNLTVTSNATIGGSAMVTGNVYSGGYVVLTANTVGYYGTALTGGIVTGSARFTSAEAATSASTGAIAIPFGGLGVFGNVNAGGFVGNVWGNVTNPVQPFITTVGSLGNLTVIGTTATNTLQATSIGVTNITATTITVTGSLTGLTQLGVSGNITAGAFVGPVYGQLQTAAQPNITSVGTLTGLTVSGASNHGITVANSFSTANAVISGGYISGIANIYATTGNITNFSSPNVMVATGQFTNFSTGNAVVSGGYIQGVANVQTPSANINSLSSTTINAATIGNVGASLVGSVSTAVQTGITAVGTLSNLSVNSTANITLVAPTTNSSGIIITGNIMPSANVTYNLGSPTAWFNTFYGVSTQAKYADLAEKYLTDQEYPVGTVVAVGGEAEVTACQIGDRAIGAISEAPAYLMNSECGGQAIALKGRVPVRVIGFVRKGQRLIAGSNGCAVAGVPHSSDVFAVALESSDEVGEKIIEALIL